MSFLEVIGDANMGLSTDISSHMCMLSMLVKSINANFRKNQKIHDFLLALAISYEFCMKWNALDHHTVTQTIKKAKKIFILVVSLKKTKHQKLPLASKLTGMISSLCMKPNILVS